MEIFQLPFMQQALMASLLVAVVCSFLGVYVVLRRIVFVGAALAQISSAGVALALILGLSPSWISLAAALVGVALFSMPMGERKLPRETVIGVGYVVSSALAVLLVAHSPKGESDVLNVLFGNVLTVEVRQIWQMVIAFSLVAVIHWLFARQFLFSAFDPEMAETLGLKTRRWDFVFYLSIGLAISVAIRAAGALLAFSLLVVPAAAALMLATRMRWAVVISILIGALSAFLGLYISFISDMPTGPTIVACAGVLLILSAGVRKLIPAH